MNSNEQRYKMVVMDMDYTLLNKAKDISPRNAAAIQKAMEMGIIVVLATGRLFRSALFYADQLEISTPIIASNGAIIKNRHTGEIIHRSILSDTAMREMIRLTREQGLYCHLYSDDTIYTEKIINISARYSEWNKRLEEKDKTQIEVVPDLLSMDNKIKSTILKAVVVDSDKEKIKNIREQILKTGIVSVTQSLKDNLEVMNAGVSKGNAVKILSEIFGVEREAIIAVGDNENDVSMIEYAGLGIAVENADESLKAVADYVTAHHELDGVGEAIEKFILNR